MRSSTCGLWYSILSSVRRQKRTQNTHVARWDSVVSKALKLRNDELAGSAALERWSDLYELAFQDEEVRKLLGKSGSAKARDSQASSRHGEKLASLGRDQFMSTKSTRRGSTASSSQGAGQTNGGTEQLSPERQSKQQLKELESVYRSLLGTGFWYETSAQGPILDLFLFSVGLTLGTSAELQILMPHEC